MCVGGGNRRFPLKEDKGRGGGQGVGLVKRGRGTIVVFQSAGKKKTKEKGGSERKGAEGGKGAIAGYIQCCQKKKIRKRERKSKSPQKDIGGHNC